MAFCRGTKIGLIIVLLQIALTSQEIHRAKTNSPKSTAKQGRVNYFDAAADSKNSEVMQEFRSEVWAYSVIASVLVGLSGIFPLLVIPMEAGPALKHGAAAAKLKLLLSFAVGGLLGDVFLHLLPEAWAHIDKGGHNHEGHTKLGLWVITGMLSFLIIEKIFAKEGEFEHLADECEEADMNFVNHQITDSDKDRQTKKTRNHKKTVNPRQRDKRLQNGSAVKSKILNSNNNKCVRQSSTTEPVKVSGYLNLAANVIDNFTHGLAVAGGFLVSIKVGFITTLAILLHEIPHEVGDFAILLRSGFNRWKAAKAQLLTATGGMVGALTALSADSAKAAGDRTAWILPFTSGGFIYIALVTVVPDLLEEKHQKESIKQILCLLLGIGAMYLVSLIH